MSTLFGLHTRLFQAESTRRRLSLGRMSLLIPFSLSLTSGPAAALVDAPEKDVKATVIIESCAAQPEFLGVATLREAASEEGIKEVSVVIRITERNRVLTEGKHAVHIHETALCQPCTSAGGHFDPGPFGMPSPDGNHPYHLGDLINLEVDTRGKGFTRTVTSRVTLSDGPLTLFDDDGSAFIIHVNPDTYCPGGEVAGCAGGARAACGLIELAD